MKSKKTANPYNAGASSSTKKNIINASNEGGIQMPAIRPNVTGKDRVLLKQLIADCIKEVGGELSKQVKFFQLAKIYITLSDKGKQTFLEILAHDFDIDIDVLDQKMQKIKEAKNDVDRIKAEFLLRDALAPPSVKFLKQLISLPDGFIFLKDMRSDLQSMQSTPKLKKLSDDIKTLLSTYFDVNLLDLIEITWDSPASLLERLMENEAVHKISSWKDMKHRLHSDHRVFGFMHYKMPNEPLIFVEVGLVNGMSDNIQKLIDIRAKSGDPAKADTAIFYSISNTQKGLEGISFGNFLIKRVVKKLSAEFKNIKTFATLSPVPLFGTWLNIYLKTGGDAMLKSDEKEKILSRSKNTNESLAILELLEIKNWHKNKEIIEVLKRPLMRLCAHFLFKVRRVNGKRAYDPVANFHLSNGAKIEHIHWLADTSKKGIAQSAGIMLNYHYRLDKIEINHEEYMTSGTVNASSDAHSWLS